MPVGPGALCTIAEVVAMLKLTDAPPDEDDVVRAIDGASDAIQRYCKRTFALGAADEPRAFGLGDLWYDAGGGGYVVPIDDLAAIESVEDSFSMLTGWTPLPVTRRPGDPITGLSFARAPSEAFTIRGQWGWPEVPEAVHYAAILQSAEWYALDSSRLSASWSAEARVPTPRGLLYAVIAIVRPFRRVSLA